MKKYTHLTPFKRCVLQNFPFIEADFDALTNYGLMCKIVEYLNKVIDSQNTVQANIEALNNFFENLDVQDEIDNKLDEMAESGELAEIISQYLNSVAIFGFNTVADMKSAENLVDGSYARTLGYYTVGDGGGALYQIKDSVTESDIFVALDSGVYAVLKSDDITANQFGCKGDGVTDDTDKLQDYIDYCIANDLNIILNAGSTYLVTSVLINAKANIFGNNAVIKGNGSADVLNINITTNNSKVLIKNVVIDANDIAESALHIVEGRNVEFCESEIKNCPTYGIKFDAGYELYVHNVNIYNTSVHNSSYAIYAISGDSSFEDIVIKQFKTAVYNASTSNFYSGIHAWNTFPAIVKGSVFFEIYAGCVIEKCFNDTCQYGYKVTRSSRNVILRQCRNFANGDFINSTVLEGEDAYIFYFADADYSSMIDNKGMVTGKTSEFDATYYYSNITRDQWKNNQNAVSNNPDTASIIGVTSMPIGTLYELSDVDDTKFTMNRQNIILSDNTIMLQLMAKFIGTTTTTASVKVGTLPYKCRFEKNVETYGVVRDERYQHPVGLCDVYINANNGEITVKFPDGDSATNQYVNIDTSLIRSNQ